MTGEDLRSLLMRSDPLGRTNPTLIEWLAELDMVDWNMGVAAVAQYPVNGYTFGVAIVAAANNYLKRMEAE